jgi:two-component system, OmpR family, sensor histidine kinase KdpD
MKMSLMQTRVGEWAWRGSAALGLVALITLFYFRFVHVNSTTVALSLLLSVLAVATGWGMPVAAVMAVAAMLCFNYFFLPPVGTFNIADPQNWVALLAFLITAITASKLSASAKQRAHEALQRQQEMERLYELSRTILLGAAGRRVAGEVPYRLAEAFDARAVAFFDRRSGQVFRAGSEASSSSDTVLEDIAIQGTFKHELAQARFLVPVSLGGHVAGSLEIVGGGISEAAVQAVANLLAIALEREAAQTAVLRSEAARQNEELKSTLLDALAHDFKTPLTSIKAAATALRHDGTNTPEQQELLTVVDEETDRLNGMVTEAIQMAKIEAGHLQVHKQPVAAEKLALPALEHVRARLDGRPVNVHVDPEVGSVEADAELISIAIQQLLDNAAKYSPPNSPLEISVIRGAGEREGTVLITVADSGPGVPEHERSRIFEKFYRGRAARERIPGTGMGLAIAREIVKAHGGEIWVDSRPGAGASFSFTLPLK